MTTTRTPPLMATELNQRDVERIFQALIVETKRLKNSSWAANMLVEIEHAEELTERFRQLADGRRPGRSVRVTAPLSEAGPGYGSVKDMNT